MGRTAWETLISPNEQFHPRTRDLAAMLKAAEMASIRIRLVSCQWKRKFIMLKASITIDFEYTRS
jgi:hypothetical protein